MTTDSVGDAGRGWDLELPDFRGVSQNVMRRVRSSPVRSLPALVEVVRSVRRRPDGEHLPADDGLEAAVAWLERAQDVQPHGGIARGYSLVVHPYLEVRGWQPAYPETTGYIIPTFFRLARERDRPDLAERAVRAARWEREVQLPSGGVVAGVMGQRDAPAFFNTGQVLLGWLCAHRETGDAAFADAATAAARFLARRVRDDGSWSADDSSVAVPEARLYNARTSWALAEAGAHLEVGEFTDAAARGLRRVASSQRPNGWLPSCCLTDPDEPLLHTLAYALRGLLEGGRVLGDPSLVEAAALGSEALVEAVSDDGSMPGRFREDWSGAVDWSCLTGQAQMCNVWLRLRRITGREEWSEPVPRVLAFLAATQNRSSGNLGVRGGLAGASPVWGDYGKYEILNWATKFFVDALVRHERAGGGEEPDLPRHIETLP